MPKSGKQISRLTDMFPECKTCSRALKFDCNPQCAETLELINMIRHAASWGQGFFEKSGMMPPWLEEFNTRIETHEKDWKR